MSFKTYLFQLYGKSGKKYCLSFECEDRIDAEMMLRDCDLDGRVDGLKESERVWEDMPNERTVQ